MATIHIFDQGHTHGECEFFEADPLHCGKGTCEQAAELLRQQGIRDVLPVPVLTLGSAHGCPFWEMSEEAREERDAEEAYIAWRKRDDADVRRAAAGM
ncbi:hypothetical protein dsx2_2609 [Desulfovibrio sp. X2]|uniref:hypothetical protein n=1 Tax=Desulfovibrio sp. X2 TaxID=941449 RepID=UPI0003589ED2|nr:hypothetical protein [Desulfovibrio sp. X2]EPR42692.1 hypothetical protein dsx2_2609 [Desulfovibrio sp. X2]